MAELAALVLPGGGVRGAYEVGVVAGIHDVLQRGPADPPPFTLFTGSSVGAINAAFLASRVDRGDMGISELITFWTSLQLDLYLRWRVPRGWLRGRPDQVGWSFLDPRPLEALVTRSVDWDGLHANAASGALGGLIVTALDISTGQTTTFAEVGRGHQFQPSRDPSRRAVFTHLGPEHILASAAFPGLFPAQRIGDTYYVDGGLRYNTPIAPAVRSGATRLVIVPTLYKRAVPKRVIEGYPSFTFFLGKLANALIADRLDYDLHVMERLNRLSRTLDDVISPVQRQRIDDAMIATRDARYRALETLIIRPTRDIGSIAAQHIRTAVAGTKGYWFRKLLDRSGSNEADWASYLLYDGLFAERLIQIGREDSLAQREAIMRFFAA